MNTYRVDTWMPPRRLIAIVIGLLLLPLAVMSQLDTALRQMHVPDSVSGAVG